MGDQLTKQLEASKSEQLSLIQLACAGCIESQRNLARLLAEEAYSVDDTEDMLQQAVWWSRMAFNHPKSNSGDAGLLISTMALLIDDMSINGKNSDKIQAESLALVSRIDELEHFDEDVIGNVLPNIVGNMQPHVVQMAKDMLAAWKKEDKAS